MHRVLMNFQHRNTWRVHFMEADCQTPVRPGSYYFFATLTELRGLLDRASADAGTYDTFDMCVRAWSRGSVYLDLTDEQYAHLKTTKLSRRTQP